MVTGHELGEIEISPTEDWYVAYNKTEDMCDKVVVQPPPKDAESFVDWMGMLSDIELEAAIQMLSDMWTFRENTKFYRYSWDELLKEKELRKSNPCASARSRALKRLLEKIERRNELYTSNGDNNNRAS